MRDEKRLPAMSIEDLKVMAGTVAVEMKSAGAGPLPPALRARFIDVRAAFFQRGVYDPILVRFDSATVARASVAEVADELEKLASSQ